MISRQEEAKKAEGERKKRRPAGSNSLPTGSVKAKERLSLQNLRSYLVNENKTAPQRGGQVVQSSPTRTCGKSTSSFSRGMRQLAQSNASGRSFSNPDKTIRETKEKRAHSSGISNGTSFSKPATQLKNLSRLELSRAGYHVSKSGGIKRNFRDLEKLSGPSDESDRFVRFVDTSNAPTRRLSLKKELGIDGAPACRVSHAELLKSESSLNENQKQINTTSKLKLKSRKIDDYSKIDEVKSHNSSTCDTIKVFENPFCRSSPLKSRNQNQYDVEYSNIMIPRDDSSQNNCDGKPKLHLDLNHQAQEPSHVDGEESENCLPVTNGYDFDEQEDIATSHLPVQNKTLRNGEVSNNFVRLNLKKQGVYRQKGGKNKANRLLKERSRALRKAKEDECGEGSWSKLENGKNSLSSKQYLGGLSSFGLDPLQMSLDTVANEKKTSLSLPGDCGRKPSITQVTRQNMRFYGAARGTLPPSVVQGRKQKRSSSGIASCESLQCGQEYLDASEAHPPSCSGHQMPAKLMTVRKAGNNKGRKFFSCCYPPEQRCDFFLWVEDNPNVLDAVYASDSMSNTDIMMHPMERWLKFALEMYTRKLESLDVTELKAEILLFNRRFSLAKKYGHLNGLESILERKLEPIKQSGRRNDLLEKLTNISLSYLCCFCHISARPTLESSDAVSEGDDSRFAPRPSSDAVSLSSEGSDDDSISIIQNDKDSDDSSSFGSLSSCEDDLLLENDAVCESENHCVGKAFASEEEMMEKNILKVLHCVFGHADLRPGQLWAIKRVLQQERSMLVLPTGAGKSLTYLLPTVLLTEGRSLGGLTVVVSPLISLMQDQLRKLPAELPGGCFSGGLTSVEAAALTEAVLQGHISILFVSPERLCMPSFRQLMKSVNDKRCVSSKNGITRETGGVNLLCVDEAHCLSQWSFNFRPSFLRIKKELEYISPKAVLALTATAPKHVQIEVMEHLSIKPSGVLVFPPRRPNILLNAVTLRDDNERRRSVLDEIVGNGKTTDSSLDENAFSIEVSNMKSRNSKKTTEECYSLLPTIVYVWRRDEAESLRDFLRAHQIAAACYHAGMEKSHRSRVQFNFIKGTVTVVVATVAFGMGIDKSNVRRVIHASLPKSVESYVQEIGRAGRDGDPAKCTLMLTNADIVQHHSLSHSQTLSSLQVLSLLRRIFIPKPPLNESHGVTEVEQIVSVNFNDASHQLDISDAMVETILSVLELPPFQLCQVTGIRNDVLKGKIQVDEQPRDVMFCNIVTEIQRLNSISDSSDQKSLGYAYAGGHSFEVSLLLLSRAVNMSVDVLSSKLWRMQCDGILVYNLSESSVYVSNSIESFDSKDANGNKNCPCYECWLWSLSEAVTKCISQMAEKASNRILDAWRLGKLIEMKTSQESITEFICNYMEDNLTPSNPSAPTTIEGSSNVSFIESTGNKDLDSLHECFGTVQLPFKTSSPFTSVDNLDAQLWKFCKTHCMAVFQELSLQELIEGMHAMATTPAGPANEGVNCARVSSRKRDLALARRDYLSITVAKILHGLGTTLVSSSEWKEKCRAIWESCREIPFEIVRQCAFKLSEKAITT